MEYGLLVVISAVIAGGVVGAMLRMWSVASRLYSLENRVNLVEGITTREVKIRASAERWKKPTADEAELASRLLHPQEPKATSSHAWWNNPALKKGAYVP